MKLAYLHVFTYLLNGVLLSIVSVSSVIYEEMITQLATRKLCVMCSVVNLVVFFFGGYR